jgi:hypothetical protein
MTTFLKFESYSCTVLYFYVRNLSKTYNLSETERTEKAMQQDGTIPLKCP